MADNINQKVLHYAASKLRHKECAKEANGKQLDGASCQCWDLAYSALIFSAKGTKPDNIYVWSHNVQQLATAQPGDIIQFLNFGSKKTETIKGSDGSEDASWREEKRGDPYHTAILKSIDKKPARRGCMSRMR